MFKFTPSKGIVEPNGKAEIKIIHDFTGLPEGGGRMEESIKLKIHNGVRIDFKCLSVVPECLIISKPN